jgi:Domain of unknown function (DUF4352)
MGTCAKCQKAVDSAARFCPDCGAPTSAPGAVPVEAGKPKNWKEFKAAMGKEWQAGNRKQKQKPPKALTAVIFVVVALAVIVAMFHSSSPTTSGTTPNTKVEETPKVYGMNDSVRVGYWSYRVNGKKWASSVGSEMMPQTADAKFLILAMSVRNEDKTASTLPPVKLVDEQGREFEQSSAGMMLENAFGPLKQLNPSVQSNGLVLFDVPRGKYWVVVSGGMTSGETAKIDLN